MNLHNRLKIEIKLPRHDHKFIANMLEKIDGVRVDLRENEGHYSPYHGKLITIEHFILFPISVSLPAFKADNILLKIKEIVKNYLLEHETAITIKNKTGVQIVIQGPMGPTTKEDIFDPLFKDNII